jgi:hypothetical protein
MTPSKESDQPRTPRSGDAWRDAQQAVSDRNIKAQAAGRAERAAHEKKVRALMRAEENGEVFR